MASANYKGTWRFMFQITWTYCWILSPACISCLFQIWWLKLRHFVAYLHHKTFFFLSIYKNWKRHSSCWCYPMYYRFWSIICGPWSFQQEFHLSKFYRLVFFVCIYDGFLTPLACLILTDSFSVYNISVTCSDIWGADSIPDQAPQQSRWWFL